VALRLPLFVAILRVSTSDRGADDVTLGMTLLYLLLSTLALRPTM
jgi:hypothetical protein